MIVEIILLLFTIANAIAMFMMAIYIIKYVKRNTKYIDRNIEYLEKKQNELRELMKNTNDEKRLIILKARMARLQANINYYREELFKRIVKL